MMPNRRRFLAQSITTASALTWMLRSGYAANDYETLFKTSDVSSSMPQLAPLRISHDRIIRKTVGLRPFRTEGPNLSVERLNEKTVCHNYGHGGSGWSLSWGSSKLAVDNALKTGADRFAVLGCGALGMTTAILLLRRGKQVTIYAKEQHPRITSSVATGVWSPESRFCLKEFESPEKESFWASMCLESYNAYQFLVGLPGNPVEWADNYFVSDKSREQRKEEREAFYAANPTEPRFAHFENLAKELSPKSEDLADPVSPFQKPYVSKNRRMLFNISAYSKYLMDEIRLNGGKIVEQTFRSKDELALLPESTLVNCTGLGSKNLFGDEKMVPVRGQLVALIPQPEVNYGLSTDDAYMLPRRDGILLGTSRNGNYGSTDLSVNEEQTDLAIMALRDAAAALKVEARNLAAA
ncbi:MAG: FAD-dependent oxidoreductase [Verrucomicrobiota bacterium]